MLAATTNRLLYFSLPPVHHWPGWASPWLWTAETWAGWTFLVLLGAALVAWRQLREARKLREASLRPFVTVDFEVEEGVVSVTVANVGATQARDVRVVFDPPLESATVGEFPDLLPRFQEILAAGRLVLPPGKRIKAALDLGPQRRQAGLRDDHQVTGSYVADVTGKEYMLDIPVDLSIYWSRGRFTQEAESDKRLKEIAATLKQIAATLKTMSPRDD